MISFSENAKNNDTQVENKGKKAAESLRPLRFSLCPDWDIRIFSSSIERKCSAFPLAAIHEVKCEGTLEHEFKEIPFRKHLSVDPLSQDQLGNLFQHRLIQIKGHQAQEASEDSIYVSNFVHVLILLELIHLIDRKHKSGFLNFFL